MLLNKHDESIVIDGITYKVGMRIIGTDASEYDGLIGTILEIRDGEDKDTENETVDIACDFYEPEDELMIKELEERFSDLYDEPKEISDIILDYVIMASDMIRPLKGCRIYQIDPIGNEFAFAKFEVIRQKGMPSPPARLYQIVFDGQLDTDDLEEIYRIFNSKHPEGYTGRSLSISDIVELYDEDSRSFYYCDIFGFKKIPFEPKQ